MLDEDNGIFTVQVVCLVNY